MGKVMVISTGLLFGGLSTGGALPFGFNQLDQVEAASLVSFSKTTYETKDNLRMRTGPSTKDKTVLTIPKGKEVTSTQKKGDWYKVSYTYKSKGKNVTKTGWVSGSYLKKKVYISKSSAPKTVTFTKTNYSISTNVNMRTSASTSSKIVLTLKKGATVTSKEKFGKWFKVSYTYTSKGKRVTKSGWVHGDYVKEYNQYMKTSGTYYFSKRTISLYSTPDTKKKAVASLAGQNGLYSTQKAVNSIGQTWYQVSFNGKSLYVNSGDVSKGAVKSFSKKDYQLKQDAYVYSSYGTVFTKLIKIPKGTIVSSVTSIGDWFAVTYQGKKGYVSAASLQTPPPKTPVVSKPTEKPAEKPAETPNLNINEGSSYLVTDDLNLRQEGNVGAAKILSIPKGTTVKSSEKTAENWYRVTYSGKTGYVSGSYLKEYQLTDYRFIDLRTKSSVTAKQINDYIAANVNGRPSVLLNTGQAFIDAGNKFGVNALYLAAHAIHESGYGTSNISLGKKNLFGYGAYDAAPFIGAYRFSSVAACINYVAQKMKSDYLNPNGTHFEGPFLGYLTKDSKGTRIPSKSIGMNFWYASDSNWGNKIAQHMQKILAYDKNYYGKAAINTNVPASPGIPAGSDKFPAGIQVKANKDLSSEVKKGTIFTMLEKSNDFKVLVNVNKKEYWLTSIRFDKYKEYISALNLGRVSGVGTDLLNIRSTTDTSKKDNIIGTLPLNSYVQLVLDSKQKLIMDKDQKWYQVKLSNGKLGWASKAYITKELP